MYMNSIFREKAEKLQATAKEERENWDRKKSSIQEGFMKELEQGSDVKKPAESGAGSSGSVDEDTVLVESGGPAASSGASKKKKKGKK